MPLHLPACRVFLLLAAAAAAAATESNSSANCTLRDGEIIRAAFSQVANFPLPLPGRRACRPVRRLHFPSRNLTGAVNWAALGNLTSLLTVDLSNNSLHGHIDGSSFWRAPLLRAVDVSRNHLEGVLRFDYPSTRLAALNVSGNRFTSVDSVAGLSGVVALDVSRNAIGTVPAGLRSLTLVRVLNLSGNHMAGMFPVDLPPLVGSHRGQKARGRLAYSVPDHPGHRSRARVPAPGMGRGSRVRLRPAAHRARAPGADQHPPGRRHGAPDLGLPARRQQRRDVHAGERRVPLRHAGVRGGDGAGAVERRVDHELGARRDPEPQGPQPRGRPAAGRDGGDGSGEGDGRVPAGGVPLHGRRAGEKAHHAAGGGPAQGRQAAGDCRRSAAARAAGLMMQCSDERTRPRARVGCGG